MMARLLTGSIRVKITLVSATLAGLILLAAAVAIVALQQQQLTSNLDNSLEQLADTYEAIVAAGDTVALSLTTDEDRAIQIVVPPGRVLLATPNISGHPPLRATLAADVQQTIVEQDLPLLEDDAYRILARVISTNDGPAQLHVAENIDDLNDAIRGLTIALIIAVPAVVTLLAGLTWWLVGRTLQPVESIRAEVSDISGTELSRRVPVSDQHDEIARLATTMNEMLQRVEAAAQRQQQFVADASHELRTPLTRIRAEIEVDLDQPTTAIPGATHRAVLAEAIELQQLLDDLLFLARSDENQRRRTTRSVDLDDVVLTEVEAVRSGTNVLIDTTGVGPASVPGDEAQLARAVRNLLSNAVRHARSTATVEVIESHGTVRLVVSDDGPGVEPRARERIFERFARADDARTREGGGSGLGLAIVQDIVRRHGGTVRCHEGSTGGARFTMELPPSSVDR